jgi:hypothetical protein
MKKTLFALLAISSFGVSAQTYVGFGYGQSDHSKLTLKDREWESLTITSEKDRPNAFGFFIGERVNKNIAYELSYLNLGNNTLSGYAVSSGNTGYATSEIKIEGLGLSFLANYDVGNFSPYVRLGLMYGHMKTVGIVNDPTPIFQNPNSSTTTSDVIKPIYGLGLSYNLDKNFSVRIDHTIIKDVYTDYINNINNGYIKRDASITTLGILYQFDGQGKISEASGGKWSVGLSGGKSQTDARMTGGRYSGNIWNLQTNTLRNTTVSGNFTDDKSDTTYKLSLFKDTDKYEYEFYVATLGEFKSKSGTSGVTGGGNALTGAAQRTANAYGANMGYKFKPNDSFVLIPKVGLALVNTRDEIYNNLDFTGIGGAERGPIVKKNVFTPTIGLIVGYKLNKTVELRGGVDYFDKTGSDSTLGKGSIATLSAGVKVGI